MSREQLARRQADLVAALVLGSPTPPGFDDRLVHVAARALTRKRAADAATHWPLLRAHLGPTWLAAFERWSAGRAPQGALRDGWDLAREIRDRLGPAARRELAEREVSWRYSGTAPPVRRRAPAVRLVGSTVVVQLAGRVRAFGLPQDHVAR